MQTKFRVQHAIALTVTAAAVALAFYLLATSFSAMRVKYEGPELRRKVANAIGKTRPEIERTLGSPEWTFTVDQYRAEQRAHIATSYEPDPPEQLEFETVLIYRDHLRLAALFLQNGRVVHVYQGLT